MRAPRTVQRSPSGFVLRDPDLARLGGPEAIPLPFTPAADPDEVLDHLRRLDPRRDVRFIPSPS